MKKTIIGILILVSGMHICKAQVQYTSSVTENGNGTSMVTIQSDNGYFANYLVQGNEDDITIEFNTGPTMGTAKSGKDSFEENIWLPDENGGAVPKDILYNPFNGKTYVYGNRRLAIKDASGNIGAFTISNYGLVQGIESFLLNPFQNLLAHNATGTKTYIATNGNELVFFDNTFENFTKESAGTDQQLSTSVLYDPNFDRVFWMVNFWKGNEFASVIKVYDGTTNEYLYGNNLIKEIFDMKLNSNGDKLICSTLEGVLVMDASNLSTLLSCDIGTVTKLEYNPSSNMVYGDVNHQEKYILVDLDNLTYTTNGIALWQAFSSTYNPTDNKVYYSGTTSTGEYRVFIIDAENSNLVTTIDIGTVFTLVYDPSTNQVICGGTNTMVSIDGSTNQTTNTGDLEGCNSFKVKINTANNTILSANTWEGTISEHNSDLTQSNIEQISMRSKTGCFNTHANKAYFITNRSLYENGLLVVIDATTNTVTNKIPIGKYMVACVYNEQSNKVFVASQWDKKITVIDGLTDDIVAEISLNMKPTKLLSFDQKIYVGGYGFAIIDANSLTTSNLFELPNFNHFTALAKDEANQMVYGTLGSNVMYAFDHTSSGTYSSNTYDGDHWFTGVAYNSRDNKVFLGSNAGLNGVNELLILDPADLGNIVNETPLADRINTIAYSKFSNKVYVLSPLSNKNLITSVDGETYAIINELSSKPNLGLLYDPINEQVFTQNIWPSEEDNREIMVKSIDCLDDQIESTEGTGNYLQMDWAMMYNDNDTKAAFDPNANKVYIANHAFSNVSVIDAYTDRLKLQTKWNWLSFPRMERYANEATDTKPVLKRINDYPDLTLDLFYLNLGTMQNLHFDGTSNTWTGDLTEVQTTKGYKLDLGIPEGSPKPEIDLYGAKLDPNTEMVLGANIENWTGYFLEYPQTPFECFDAMTWEKLTMVKTQYWSMVKTTSGIWLSKGKVGAFQYGDLVILRTSEPITFSWVNSGNQATVEDVPVTEYYSYTEQADYLPVYVEFDPASQVQEVAVTVDGNVKGAAVRNAGDSIVEVRAYLEGTPPDATLQLQTWDGYKSAPVGAEEYVVHDPRSGEKVRRRVYAGENAHYQWISLKQGETAQTPAIVSGASVSPNPFTNETLISFRLGKATDINISIYDINGRKVKTLVKGQQPGGYFEISWKGDNDSGNRVKKGVYFYMLRTNEGTTLTDKIVIL